MGAGQSVNTELAQSCWGGGRHLGEEGLWVRAVQVGWGGESQGRVCLEEREWEGSQGRSPSGRGEEAVVLAGRRSHTGCVSI